MELGISTACFFARMDVEDAVNAIADMECKTLEVFLNTASEYTEAFCDMLAKRVFSRDLSVYSVHPMGSQFEPQLFSIYRRQREDAFKVYEQVLQAARQLRALVYVMHGPSGMRGAIKNMTPEWLGAVTRDLCAMAKAYGVKLSWENVSWCLFSAPEFANVILDAAGTDDLYFTFDIKQAARSGHDPFAYLEAMAPKLINVHLCDYICEAGRVVPRMPFAGSFPFLKLSEKLSALRYRGPSFLEVYSDMYAELPDLKACFDRVKKDMA